MASTGSLRKCPLVDKNSVHTNAICLIYNETSTLKWLAYLIFTFNYEKYIGQKSLSKGWN